MESISAIRGRHRGTFYVFGSGDELDELDPESFKGEQTIAMNLVPLAWPITPTYAITKYYGTRQSSDDNAERLIAAGICTVVARGVYGHVSEGHPPSSADYVFDHLPLPGDTSGFAFDATEHWPQGEGMLCNGPTVAITALHFAAYLGAERIVLRGCGGHGHLRGYYEGAESVRQRLWLDRIRPIVRKSAQEITRRYGVPIEGVP